MLGERDVVFRVGNTEVTTRLIEGEFPNYQQLIPSGYPNRLTVSRDALQAAVNRVRLVGQSRDSAPIRLGDERRRPGALRHRPGRRRGARGGRGEVRGHRSHRRVQLAVPPRRHRRRGVRRSRARVDRPVEAGGDARARAPPTSSTCSCPCGSRDACTSPALSLADFRCYERAELRFPPGVTLIVGRERAGQDQPARGGRLGRDRRVVPRRRRRGARARRGRKRRSCVPRSCDGGAAPTPRGRDPARRPQPGAAQRSPAARGAATGVELMRVTVFAPDDLQLVKGGPAERRGYLDDLLVAVSPRYEAVRSDYDRVLRQRNALLKQRFGSDPDDETTLRGVRCAAGACGRRADRGAACGCSSAWCRPSSMPTPSSSSPGPSSEPAAIRTRSRRRTSRSGPGAHADDIDDLESALLEALASRRRAELDRRITLAGPHRDEWRLQVRRARRPHARVAGRAAHARARAAARRAPSRHRRHRHRAGVAPRRRVQRARRAPFRRARREPRVQPDAGHHRGRRCRRACAPSTCCASTPGRCEAAA